MIYFVSKQKKLLTLWIGSSNRQPWSIANHIPSINADLGKIHYPSTTSRAPRNLTKCFKLKANESRILLLIGYPVFKKYLAEIYYNHLRMLAFGIAIGESHEISLENICDMETLLGSFVDTFPYHERYIVQNIHSVKHFATTVRDFGPLFNYSTFNYESVIGRIITKYFLSSKLLCFSCRVSVSVHPWHQTTWCRINQQSQLI